MAPGDGWPPSGFVSTNSFRRHLPEGTKKKEKHDKDNEHRHPQ